MNSNDMKQSGQTIVCATRGGAGSRAVQERAISHAAETDSGLVFLYIIDTSNVGSIEEQLHEALQEELRWMGGALLNIAYQRAENQNINSRIVIRVGKVQDEICKFLENEAAERLFIGAPRGVTTTFFGDDPIERFAEAIEQESGVTVEIVHPEQSMSDLE